MRYNVRKGPLECWHVPDSNGKPLSAIAVVDHALTAGEMAFHLTQAAAWFQRVADGKATPSPSKERQARVFTSW